MNYNDIISKYKSEIETLNSEIETSVSKLNSTKESLDNAIDDYTKLLMNTIIENIDTVKDLANESKDITFNGYYNYSSNYYISYEDLKIFVSDGMYRYNIGVSVGELKYDSDKRNGGVVTKEFKEFFSKLEARIYKLAEE